VVKVAIAAALLSAAAHSAPFAEVPANDAEHNTRRKQEFTQFNPRFEALKADRVKRLRALGSEVARREADRQSTACSHQILWELKLLVGTTADFNAIDARIRDLEVSLAHPQRESAAEVQSTVDGSWGSCFESWPLKLMASYDHWDDAAALPFRFLDRVNSPEKLTGYLTSLATSDLAKTGVDHSFELNESLSDLMRLILRDRPEGYPWHPRLKATMLDLLMNRFRNPDTGWWGERYVRDGGVKFVDDLSMTFHTVSYLEGKVPDWSKIIETTFALKEVDFPVGWLYNGAYWNHNNMDVAVLFRYGWPLADAGQRQAMQAELQKMLNWCLTESLQPDGSFLPILPDASLEEANYFGAVFLARIGYFDRGRRFWTNADFAGADAIRRRILDNVNKHIKTGGAGGHYYKSILEELQ
jgi:hypothetical protein